MYQITEKGIREAEISPGLQIPAGDLIEQSLPCSSRQKALSAICCDDIRRRQFALLTWSQQEAVIALFMSQSLAEFRKKLRICQTTGVDLDFIRRRYCIDGVTFTLIKLKDQFSLSSFPRSFG